MGSSDAGRPGIRKSDLRDLGPWGEAVAARWLEERGHTVLERGWHCRYGEIDLITAAGGYLCFVEVKTRRSDRFAQAREAVSRSKQEKLILSAQLYLVDHPTTLQPRFDVLEVYAPAGKATVEPRLVYWENAFY